MKDETLPVLRVLLSFVPLCLFHSFLSFSRGRRRNVRFSRLLLVSPSRLPLYSAPPPQYLFLSPSTGPSRGSPTRCKGGCYITLCNTMRALTNESVHCNSNNDSERDCKSPLRIKSYTRILKYNNFSFNIYKYMHLYQQVQYDLNNLFFIYRIL